MVPEGQLRFEADGFTDAAVRIKTRTGDDKEHVIEIQKPLRAGHVLDVLLSQYKNSSGSREQITIGGWVLDPAYNTLADEQGEIIKLTEKETAILSYLKAQDSDVVKEELLRAVWEYAEDVETHTLETHIYRLRQKIEKDPANPDIVITTEKGYRLKA